ncbi:MOSC N-terminal beta barrel domain-containing protein, partial [Halorubrum sp. SP9]
MARVERLTVFPVKGLDGVDVEAARVLDGGTLERDREFAL